MPSSKDYPAPRLGTSYRFQYQQGAAVEHREICRLAFMDAATIQLVDTGAFSYVHDDSFGIIETKSVEPQREALGL